MYSDVKLDTVIRCHIKDDKRFELFRDTINSWFDKELYDLGKLIVVDDKSPEEYRIRIQKLCMERRIAYYGTTGIPGTVNGLYHSLKYSQDFPVLCCTDDIVFGHGIKDELRKIVTHSIPTLNEINTRWATIGLFACYPNSDRPEHENTGLWNIPVNQLYALTCHIFSADISHILINQYEKSLLSCDILTDAEKEALGYQDDIWVAINAQRVDMLCFNTKYWDYAQHTGMNNRSFSTDAGSSNYQTPCFIGE